MSQIIDKLLQDLDRRHAAKQLGAPQADSVAPSQNRPDRRWFWRIVAVLTLIAVGWAGYVAWNTRDKDLATVFAHAASYDRRVAAEKAANAAAAKPAPPPAAKAAPAFSPCPANSTRNPDNAGICDCHRGFRATADKKECEVDPERPAQAPAPAPAKPAAAKAAPPEPAKPAPPPQAAAKATSKAEMSQKAAEAKKAAAPKQLEAKWLGKTSSTGRTVQPRLRRGLPPTEAPTACDEIRFKNGNAKVVEGMLPGHCIGELMQFSWMDCPSKQVRLEPVGPGIQADAHIVCLGKRRPQ